MKKLMRYRITAGRAVEVRDVLMETRGGTPRGARRGKSSAKQLKRNEDEAVLILARQLNANCKGGDLFLTLKYSDSRLPATREEAAHMTTLQLRRLRAYNAAGWNDCQIADELGLTVGTVYYWRRLKLGLPAHRDASHKRLRDYTVYDRHGNVAAFGTARECARALGVKVETIYRLASRSARCRDGRVVREPDS